MTGPSVVGPLALGIAGTVIADGCGGRMPAASELTAIGRSWGRRSFSPAVPEPGVAAVAGGYVGAAVNGLAAAGGESGHVVDTGTTGPGTVAANVGTTWFGRGLSLALL